MQTINFVGIEPNALISEIVGKIKNELFAELQRSFKDNEPKRYLSADEVCKRLGITTPTIHDWRKRGILKTYKLGSRVYYRMDDIENAMIISQ